MPGSLTKAEVVSARANLAQWQVPERFRQFSSELKSKVGGKDLFNRPELSFVRDAWVIGEFTLKRRVDRVRLSSEREQWPDGYFEFNGISTGIEVTEALEPGRRRGDEFKSDTPWIEEDPVEDWVKRADQIPDALEKAITEKVAMKYAAPVILLVYLNISEWDIRHVELVREIQRIKSRHLVSFTELHILWKGKWY